MVSSDVGGDGGRGGAGDGGTAAMETRSWADERPAALETRAARRRRR